MCESEEQEDENEYAEDREGLRVDVDSKESRLSDAFSPFEMSMSMAEVNSTKKSVSMRRLDVDAVGMVATRDESRLWKR